MDRRARKQQKEVLANDLPDCGVPQDGLETVIGSISSGGSDYNFTLKMGQSPRFYVRCDDHSKSDTDECREITGRIQKPFEHLGLTQSSRRMYPPSAEDITDALRELYDEFKVPKEDRIITVEYRA